MLVPSGIHAKYPIPRNAKSLRNPRFSRAFTSKITHSIPRRLLIIPREHAPCTLGRGMSRAANQNEELGRQGTVGHRPAAAPPSSVMNSRISRRAWRSPPEPAVPAYRALRLPRKDRRVPWGRSEFFRIGTARPQGLAQSITDRGRGSRLSHSHKLAQEEEPGFPRPSGERGHKQMGSV